MIQFTLPMPPSMNSIWRGKAKGVYRSAEYMKWIIVAGNMLKTYRIATVTPPYIVDYEFGRKVTKKGEVSKARMDVANREKALSDLLQKMGVIEDDCLINDMRLRWSQEVEPNMVRITVGTL
jgi:crossover junction endodeoxyribonuclease RusA